MVNKKPCLEKQGWRKIKMSNYSQIIGLNPVNPYLLSNNL